MIKYPIFAFIAAMWILLLIGGGIVVTMLGPISISGFGELDSIASSGVKAVAAIILVVIWILTLLKTRDWIFQKKIQD